MSLPRIHAFEWNEREDCPRFIRESIVEALGTGLRWGRIYEAAGPLFADFVRRARCERVLDLCSGSGEPCSILLDALARRGVPAPRFVLSDLLPNVPAMERVAARHPGRIEVVREPLDATAVPERLDAGARTIMSAFHHFAPPLARRILEDCVRKGRAVFILEGFQRGPLGLASILPAMTAACLANPFRCERDRLVKAFFTFAVPLIPAAGIFDATVSALRLHGERELRAMVEPLGGGYRWEYHELPRGPLGRTVAFFGVPGG